MVLVVDLGNTSCAMGFFEEQQLNYQFKLSKYIFKKEEEAITHLRIALAEYHIDPRSIKSIILSSVVTELTDAVTKILKFVFKQEVFLFTGEDDIGLRIQTQVPVELGTDRIASAVAAYRIFKGPIITIDFGTATTFGAISRTGEFLGGAIAPGIRLCLDSLWKRTSKLPKIQIEEAKIAIGKNTKEAILSGVLLGHVGMVETMVRAFKEEMGTDAMVVATGGHAQLVASRCSCIQIVREQLTLEGLKFIHDHLLTLKHTDF